MRLRLSVRRHALPEVNIVWNLDLESKPTTSRFLDAVSDVVPLESCDWGLEDYAVELRDRDGNGFELLHFQPLASILQEDDSVLIRPLLTHDLKQRRLSGRHQISSDGKHLIDGIAFGRPRLKTPRDRPDIDIPPRKKRRVLELEREEEDDEDDIPRRAIEGYPADDEEEEDDDFVPGDEEEESSEESSSEELLLLTNGEPAHDEEDDAEAEPERDVVEVKDLTSPRRTSGYEDKEDDSEASEESSSSGGSTADDTEDDDGDSGDDNLNYELKELQRDMMEHDGSQSVANMDLTPAMSKNLAKSPRKRLTEVDTLDKLARLRHAFPQTSIGVREVALMHSDFDQELAYYRLRQDYDPALSLQSMLEGKLSLGLGSSGNTQSQELSTGVMADADDEGDEPSQPEEASWVSRFDNLGFPSGTITSGSGLSVMASIKKIHDDSFGSASTPKALSTEGPPQKRRKVQGTDIIDPGSSGNGAPGSPPSVGKGNSGISDSSDNDANSSDSDLSSDSESSLDESADKDTNASPGRKAGSKEPRSINGTESDSSSESSSSSSISSSSGDGSSDESDAVKGIDSDQTSDSESEASSETSESDSDDSSSSDSGPEETTAHALNHTARNVQVLTPASASREALLKSTAVNIASPISATKGQQLGEPVPPGHGLSRTQKRNARRRAALKARKQPLEMTSTSHQPVLTSEKLAPSGLEVEARKKALLSMFSEKSERLSQTSQGVEGPDNRSEEEFPTSTNDTTSGSKAGVPLDWSIARSPAQASDEPISGFNTSDEQWRQRIEYSAVECCHDGVKLSEPPFPFVQRWDPQQQNLGNERRRKSKRSQRNQSHFYEQDGWTNGKKRKLDDANEDLEQPSTLNYDEPSGYDAEAEQTPSTVTKRTGQVDDSRAAKDWGSQFTDMDDLPSLPSDLTTLPRLSPGEAKPGMVITWKKYVLGSITNWQPEVVDFTAIVVNPTEDVTGLQVVLARRDLDIESQPKQFDEEGNRVYDRFEAIDDDAEENEPDTGYRVINFADMIEPRIVQQAAEKFVMAEARFSAPNHVPGLDASLVQTEGNSTVIHHDLEEEQNAQQGVQEGLGDEPKPQAVGAGNHPPLGEISANLAIRIHEAQCASDENEPVEHVARSTSISREHPDSQIPQSCDIAPEVLPEVTASSVKLNFDGNLDPKASEGLDKDSNYMEQPVNLNTSAPKDATFSVDGIDSTTAQTEESREDDKGANAQERTPCKEGLVDHENDSSHRSPKITSDIFDTLLANGPRSAEAAHPSVPMVPAAQEGSMDIQVAHDSLPSSPSRPFISQHFAEPGPDVTQAEDVVVFRSDDSRAMAGASSVPTTVAAGNAHEGSELDEGDCRVVDSAPASVQGESPRGTSGLKSDASPNPSPSSEANDEMDMSITTQRRHEISQLMIDAGFRNDVSPSVVKGRHFELLSPSAQLHEEAAAASSVASGRASPKPPTILPNTQANDKIEAQPGSPSSPASPVGADMIKTSFKSATVGSVADSNSVSASPAASPRSEERPPPELSLCQDQALSEADAGSIELGSPALLPEGDFPASSNAGRESPQSPPKPAVKSVSYYEESSDVDISDEFPSLQTLSQRVAVAKARTASMSPSSSGRKRKSPPAQHDSAIEMSDNNKSRKTSNSQSPSVQTTRLPSPAHRAAILSIKEETPSQVRNSTDPPRHTQKSLLDLGPISPPRGQRSQRTSATQSKFTLPPGTQVIELSSSPEPVFEENYCDSDLDETYREPESQLSTTRRSVRTRSRGRSMPVVMDEADVVGSQSQPVGRRKRGMGDSLASSDIPSTCPVPGGAASRGKRKTSARF